jgi:hypothetical protein
VDWGGIVNPSLGRTQDSGKTLWSDSQSYPISGKGTQPAPARWRGRVGCGRERRRGVDEWVVVALNIGGWGYTMC